MIPREPLLQGVLGGGVMALAYLLWRLVEVVWQLAAMPSLDTRIRRALEVVVGIGVFLGAGVDAETDGQPNTDANGDDVDGTDDEDGVTFGLMQVGQLRTSVTVEVSATAKLDAWERDHPLAD